MKRIFTRSFLLLVCAIICLFPFATSTVKADEGDAVVYYQAIVKRDDSTYSAINAVSQYYFKDTNNLNIVSNTNNFTSINENSICRFTGMDGQLCNNGTLKGSIATLKMTRNGEITIELQNDVTITNLRIFYIIANQNEDGDTRLFCDNYTLCPNAATIFKNNNGQSNWLNTSKSGTMVYTETSIEDVFTKTTTISGRVNYSGFRLYNVMSPTYADYSESAGVYVTMSFTVKYKENNVEKEYSVNKYTLDNKWFTSIDSATSPNPSPQVITTYNANSQGSTDGITSIPGCAALVKTNEATDADGNKSFNRINEFFKKYLFPIILVGVGILFIVTGTTTGITIVKSGDEPEVRSAAIKKFIGLFIGAVVIFVILIFYEEIINVVSGYFG